MNIIFLEGKDKGFTLIELILSISISSVLLLTTSMLLSSFLEIRIKNQAISEVEGQGLFVMRTITQSVRNASGINTPLQGSAASSISLQVDDSALNPTIFDLSAGSIRISEGVNPPIALINSRVLPSGFKIENLSRSGAPGIVRIQFALSHVNQESRNEYGFSKTFFASASIRKR